MAIFKSGNPALTVFKNTVTLPGTGVMTEKGTLSKFFMLFVLVMASASLTWKAAADGVNVMPLALGAGIAGFVFAMITIFKNQWSAYTAPVYALLEGVFLGSISAVYNNAFAKVAPGIVMQAVLLTFGVGLAMFVLYRFRVIRATERFKSVIITATLGIAIFYVLATVLRFFAVDIAFIHEGSTMGIVFSLVVVGIAALNLILDFDLIEQGVAAGAPKYMEWYGAFALMVTLVWLYLEILRLLSKMYSRK